MAPDVFDSAVFKEIRIEKTEPATAGWTTSNVTTDRSIDANAAVAVIGDGLCTLIEDLKTKGIIE